MAARSWRWGWRGLSRVGLCAARTELAPPCLARSGAEEESPGAGDVYSDDDEGFDDPEADIGFGDGLPGLGEDAGAAWASGDEEFPVVEDGDA